MSEWSRSRQRSRRSCIPADLNAGHAAQDRALCATRHHPDGGCGFAVVLGSRRQGDEARVMGIKMITVCRWVAATLLGITAVACTSTDADTNNLPPLGDSFNCDDPIDVLQQPPDAYTTVADVVALPVTGDRPQGGRVGPDNDAGSRRAFSKMGLLVRPATTFQIHVAPSSQEHVDSVGQRRCQRARQFDRRFVVSR